MGWPERLTRLATSPAETYTVTNADWSGETFREQACLRQAGDIHEESQHPGMHERRGNQTPPLSVRGARPEAGAPAEERGLIAERAGTKEHANEDRHVQGDECRSDDRPSRACAEDIAEGIGRRTPLTYFFYCFLEKILKAEKEPLPLLGRHQVQNEARDDQQKKESHESVTPNTSSTSSRRVPAGRRNSGQILHHIRPREHRRSPDLRRSDEDCNELVVSQGFHRRDARRMMRRQRACGKRHNGHENDRAEERREVESGNLEEQRLHRPSGHPRADDAERCPRSEQPQREREELTADLRWPRAERHANADFAAALRDGITRARHRCRSR